MLVLLLFYFKCRYPSLLLLILCLCVFMYRYEQHFIAIFFTTKLPEKYSPLINPLYEGSRRFLERYAR